MVVHVDAGRDLGSVPVMPYCATKELCAQHVKTFDRFLYFMASKAADPSPTGFVLHPTAAQKDQWAREMAAAYPIMDPAKREEIAQIPTQWPALRVLWPTLSADERAKLAAGWAQTPAVQALAVQVKKGQDDAQLQQAKRIGHAHWAHRQAINMGLYRLNYNYRYK